MSQKIGVKPFQTIQCVVAANVNGVVMISEPGGKLNAFIAVNKAIVPLLNKDR